MSGSTYSYTDEYLHTNKLGAYTSSTFHHGNTRKYHGLLNASIGRLERINLVNRLIESVALQGDIHKLSIEDFSNDEQKESANNLIDFSQNPLPYFHYLISNTHITKEILLAENENSVFVKYTIDTPEALVLKVQPVISCRDIHKLKKYTSEEIPDIQIENSKILISFKNSHRLEVSTDNAGFSLNPEIYYNFYYEEEAERGYESSEDLFIPGILEYKVPPGKHALLLNFRLVTSEISPRKGFLEEKNAYLSHRSDFTTKAKFALRSAKISKPVEKLTESLVDQSYSFLTQEVNHNGIVAGYPWFDEWSRDTFISIFGLLFATKNFETAKKIFIEWGKFLHLGLLPNRILYPDYLNSVDSILWYVVRLYQYTELTKDYDLAEELLPELEKVFLSFLDGKNGIRISWNELLEDANTTEAMTWMDAKVNGNPVIKRNGYAVEIQGLWYNFVRILIEFKERFNDHTHLTKLRSIKVVLEANFNSIFWNRVQYCLYDVVNEKSIDNSVRPNQVILLVLPFPLVKTNASKHILKTAERYLLTPVGLRTLNKENINYQAYYQGNQEQRDYAYHQGTVWPFLLGIFLTATLKTYKKNKNSVLYVQNKLIAFHEFLNSNGLNYVPEIFSSEDLRPNGCLSQAWSVATLLETIYELNN